MDVQYLTATSLSFVIVPFIVFLIFSYIDDLTRRKRISRISKRYIFVTGCDSGFGMAIAKYLDKLGLNVFAGCLTEKGEKNLKSECTSRLMTVSLDITDRQSIARALNIVKENIPSKKDLWGLVNNAGVFFQKPFEMHREQDIRRLLDVNVIGMMSVTQAFLPLIRKSRGRIVNISSIGATIIVPWKAVYCLSKTCAESLTTCLQREFYHAGIKSATIRPGSFQTNIYTPEIVRSHMKAAYDDAEDEVREFYGGNFYNEAEKEFCSVCKTFETDLSLVAREVEHALFSVRPRRVYYAGNDAKFVFRLYEKLPESVVDWLLTTVKPDGAKNNI